MREVCGRILRVTRSPVPNRGNNVVGHQARSLRCEDDPAPNMESILKMTHGGAILTAMEGEEGNRTG